MTSPGRASLFALSVFTLVGFVGARFLRAHPQGNLSTTSAETVLRLFQDRYRAARSLQATFLERYSEGGQVVRTEAGTAYFRRPGRMRWEYESPEKNLFLVDGKTAWFYVPGDHTVTRVSAKQSGDFRTPLALLAGEMKVSRVCARVEIAAEKPESDKDALLRCVLRGAVSKDSGAKGKNSGAADAGKQRSGGAGAAGAKSGEAESAGSGDGQQDLVFFEVERETGNLKRLIVRQSGGVEVEFRFENWRIDPPLAESMFRFTVPLGVAIVNGDAGAAGEGPGQPN
ncbi:MAG TPA: outer membrane lipoprotein carrier protein LolA [Candidatus Acidoferrum sp.]